MLQILKHCRGPKLVLAVVLGVAVAVSGCGKKETDKEIVASYTGGQITRTELNKFTSIFFSQYGDFAESVEMQEYLLKQLATLKIMADRATEDSKKEAETEANSQIQQMEDYYESMEKGSFNKQLKELDISKKELEQYVTLSTTVLKDTSKQVTDEQIKASYDEKLQQDSHLFDITSVAHILIALNDPNDTTGATVLRTKEEALVRANEVKAKLDQGEDFAALAKQYSDDPGSKDTGGVYENENMGSTMWDPAFKQAALDQPVGQVGQPFESSFGYHIMRVDKRETQSVDEVKESLRTELADGMIGDFIENELPNLEFQTHLPDPSPSPEDSPEEGATAAPETSPEAGDAASPEAGVEPSPSPAASQ